jgi:gliding motility-associated-like protein
MLKLFLIALSLLLHSYSGFCQTSFDYYFSNGGSDTSSGTSPTSSKKTLTKANFLLSNFFDRNRNVRIGLRAGDVFKEAYSPNHPVQMSSYANKSIQAFSILDGAKSFDKGWMRSESNSNTYQQNIAYTKFTGRGINNIGNYSYIYVYEIDKAKEHTAPFTSRRLLELAPSQQSVDSIKGSFYEQPSTHNPMTVYIHTSDGLSPNNHPKYRYEVTVFGKAIDGYMVDNSHFKNMWVRGYGSGYGLLPGGANTTYENIIFGPGAAVHHAVAKSGVFDQCLFLPGPQNTNGGGAVVFYNVEGFYNSSSITKSIFLDIPYPVFSHTSGGTPHKEVKIDKTFLFAPNQTGRAFGADNTEIIKIDSVFADGFARGYQGTALHVFIRNSQFINIRELGIGLPNNKTTAEINNVFINKGNGGYVTAINAGQNAALRLTNSIIHLSSRDQNVLFLRVDNRSKSTVQAKGNIFICDVNTDRKGTFSEVNTDLGARASTHVWDNNIYVQLKGNAVWKASNRNTNHGSAEITNLKDWQIQSGQDQHSLFIDLRNDPRGLKAIFIDPDKGNYTIANTVYGNRIRNLNAGMTNPPTCFPKRPSYEAAAKMIQSNTVLSLNECKAPCQATLIQLETDKQINSNGIVSICQNEEVIFSGKAVYPENGSSYTQSDENARFLWWSSDEVDTSGIFLLSIKKIFTSPGLQTIQLQTVDANGCTSETAVKIEVRALPKQPVITGDTAICNGETILLQLQEKVEAESYTWGNNNQEADTLLVSKPGLYWVNAKNEFGCSLTDSFTMAERNPVKVSLGEDRIYCISEPLTLIPKIEGSIESVKWSNGYGGNQLVVDNAGVYDITVTSAGQCIAKDSITIKASPLNGIRLPTDSSICEGSTMRVDIKIPANTTFTWNDHATDLNRNLSIGQYTLALQNKECLLKSAFILNAIPLPAFNRFKDTTICEGDEITLNAHYPGATNLWNTGSTSSTVDTKKGGSYWAQTSVNGCTYRDTIYLKTIECECNIVLPNVFSPNGDGINDLYRPQLSCFPQNYLFRVFNRYGQEIFQTRDFRTHWDGTSNGRVLPVGTYYFVMTYFDLKRFSPAKYSGSITLLR